MILTPTRYNRTWQVYPIPEFHRGFPFENIWQSDILSTGGISYGYYNVKRIIDSDAGTALSSR